MEGADMATIHDFQSRKKKDDAPKGNDPGAELDFILASDVQQCPVDWLWRNRIARGKQNLIGGDPGVGKSQIVIDMIARITRGSSWPDGGRAPLGNCMILSAEDKAKDTLCPRLDAAGADLSRVPIIQSVAEFDGKRRSFNLANDLELLARAVDKVGNVAMIMIDPVTAYLGGKVDSHRTTDVRAILEPLDRFADDHKVAIVCITHPPKAAQSKAINSFTGSLAFAAAARMAFVAIDDPEDPLSGLQMLLPVKNNIGPMAPGLAYRRIGCVTEKGIQTTHVVWDPKPVKISANDAMRAADGGGGGKAARQEAEDFLKADLADGPKSALDLTETAKALGISERTLKRAPKDLGVVSEKPGYQKPWLWSLPPDKGGH
jgi:putative DNA primase/helicase